MTVSVGLAARVRRVLAEEARPITTEVLVRNGVVLVATTVQVGPIQVAMLAQSVKPAAPVRGVQGV